MGSRLAKSMYGSISTISILPPGTPGNAVVESGSKFNLDYLIIALPPWCTIDITMLSGPGQASGGIDGSARADRIADRGARCQILWNSTNPQRLYSVPDWDGNGDARNAHRPKFIGYSRNKLFIAKDKELRWQRHTVRISTFQMANRTT